MNPLDISLPNLPWNVMAPLLIAGVLGFAYSFLRGASVARLIFSILASIAGFYLGQLIAGFFHWNFVVWNGVHLIEGIVGSLLALWIVNS